MRARETLVKILALTSLVILAAAHAVPLFAQGEEAVAFTKGMKFLAMAIAVTGSCIGGGYAVARVGAAACAAAAERPELAGRFIIYLGLAEGVCIYGVLIAVMIWIA